MIRNLQVLRPSVLFPAAPPLDWDVHTWGGCPADGGIAKRFLIMHDFAPFLSELIVNGDARPLAVWLAIMLSVDVDGWSYVVDGHLEEVTGLPSDVINGCIKFLCASTSLPPYDVPILQAARISKISNGRKVCTAYKGIYHADEKPNRYSQTEYNIELINGGEVPFAHKADDIYVAYLNGNDMAIADYWASCSSDIGHGDIEHP